LSASQPRRGFREHVGEERLILRIRLILDRQRFRVVREPGLDGSLAFGDIGLEVEGREIGEQPGHLVGSIAAELRPGQRRRQ